MPVKHVCNRHWWAFSLGGLVCKMVACYLSGKKEPKRQEWNKWYYWGERLGQGQSFSGRIQSPLGRDHKGPGIGNCLNDVTRMGQPPLLANHGRGLVWGQGGSSLALPGPNLKAHLSIPPQTSSWYLVSTYWMPGPLGQQS